ncbi:unnamed protein product [Musa acuminata subsp. burmannicoides]
MRCASHAVSYQLVVTLTISGTTENTMRGPHRGASLIWAACSFQHRPSSAPKILTFSLACEENPKQTSTWRRLGAEGEAAAVGGKGCRSVGWMKGMAARLLVASIVLVICTLLLFSAIGVWQPQV